MTWATDMGFDGIADEYFENLETEEKAFEERIKKLCLHYRKTLERNQRKRHARS